MATLPIRRRARSPENGDTADGIVFAWGITFITESHLLCLTAQVDAHRPASELGELGLKFPVQTPLQPPASDGVSLHGGNRKQIKGFYHWKYAECKLKVPQQKVILAGIISKYKEQFWKKEWNASLSPAFKLCKGETDGANKPQPVPFLVETKGTSFAFGSNYNPCRASSAALICHQARAVTTELSLRRGLFFVFFFAIRTQQPGAASWPGIGTRDPAAQHSIIPHVPENQSVLPVPH